MSDLTRKDWSLGWVPSQDRNNGDPRGLLRMDNLHLDEEGVLSLARGTEKVNASAFSELTVHSCFSKYVYNTKWRYVGLSDGSVLRSEDDFSSPITVVEPGTGSPTKATFGSTLGCNFIFSNGSDGRKREYWSEGELKTFGCTPEAPTEAPEVAVVNQLYNRILGETWVGANFSLQESEGANLSVATNSVTFDTTDTGATNPRLYRAVVLYTGDIDTRVTGTENPLAEDGFSISVRIQDTNILKKVRIEFILDDVSTSKNYYWYEWPFEYDSGYTHGKSKWSTLRCDRNEFTREGGDAIYDWTTVIGLRVIVESHESMEGNAFDDLRFWGGEQGQLNGVYDYMQINVSNNGAYVAKSTMSPVKESVFVYHGYVVFNLATPTDESVNEIRFYRRSSDYTKVDNIPSGSEPKLSEWYLVATAVKAADYTWQTEVSDITSDYDALLQNEIYYPTFASLKDYPDEILGMVSEYNGRAIYLTFKEILLSDIRDPGIIDTAATIKLSGDPTQKNLWIKKTHPGQFYVGTTSDIYLLRGTLGYLADGSIDVQIDSLGVDSKPLSAQVDEESGILYYVTSDGVKYITGSEINTISHPLKLLFEGHDRYEMPGVKIYTYDSAVYPIVVAKGKIWLSVPLTAYLESGDSRVVFVYDIAKRYWTTWFSNPIAFYREEDGNIIAGYIGWLRTIDTGNSLDGSDGQNIFFETIADANGQPRNRKDTFTFKLKADTGNVPISILIAKEGSNLFYEIGQQAFNGKQEKLVTIAETIGLGKQFAVRLRGTGLTTCKIYEFTIEYDPRPEQLTYLRIPATNLGTVSRKRFVNFPFVIDTLGTECEFFPLIDNAVIGSSSVFSTESKQTFIHYFFPTDLTDSMQSEFVGTDIGGIICGFFEFYGVNFDEIVSEKLPVPVKSMLIPGNDYGTPNRKRHSSYKFQINTRGKRVQYTPRVDQSWKTASVHITSEKQTVEHFFTDDTIGIDIGGRLDSLDDTPFEFYGVIVPQDVETLPPRLLEFRIPENNYGHAAKKRIRTMPMVINTNGANVQFIPIVDNVELTPTVLNTSVRMTTYHYFDTDIFGTDFSGELKALTTTPFEFYGLMQPEAVEVLPVPKKFDQLNFRVDRVAKIYRMRLRAITEETRIAVKINTEKEVTLPNMTSNAGKWSGYFTTVPNTDDVWEVVLPKSIYGTNFRIELGPTNNPFHRYDLQLLLSQSGQQSDSKWTKVK